MISFIERKKSTLTNKIISAFIVFTFIFTTVIPPQARAQVGITLPAPQTMVMPTNAYTPILVNGLTVHPENPLQFDFIVSKGDSGIQNDEIAVESKKLIKYFLAGLTVPEKEMWVNLSPYEKNRIISEKFGATEMGRDLLAQDYLLKQLTASMMYPEDETGKSFWERVYSKAMEKFGTTDIPMNTFNKIWIVPESAKIYENGNSAFVLDSKLKVMLEEDYVALQKSKGNTDFGVSDIGEANSKAVSGVSSEVVREVLIPEIEKEVNEGKVFANLRQIYNSIILAVWYKNNLQDSLLSQVYVNKSKTKGVNLEDPKENQEIYNQYLEAFQKGVYNYIREDYDPVNQEVIPRRYFSGGITDFKEVKAETKILTPSTIKGPDQAMAAKKMSDSVKVTTDLLEYTGNNVKQVEKVEAKGPDAAMITGKPAFAVLAQSSITEHGAYTSQLHSVYALEDADGILAGHSEVRAAGMTDEQINAQIKAAIAAGAEKHNIVLCVGETWEEKKTGKTADVLKKQILTGLKDLSAGPIAKIKIAYEPRWAIKGSGANIEATPQDAQFGAALARSYVQQLVGETIAKNVTVMYGGGADAKNAKDYLSQPDVDGLLIGSMSISVEKFAPMLQVAQRLSKKLNKKIYMYGNWKTYKIDHSQDPDTRYDDFVKLFKKYEGTNVEIAIAPQSTEIMRLAAAARGKKISFVDNAMTAQEAMDLDVTTLTVADVKEIFSQKLTHLDEEGNVVEDNFVPITFWGNFGKFDHALPKTTFDKDRYGGKGAGLGEMANELPPQFLNWVKKVKGIDVNTFTKDNFQYDIPQATLDAFEEKNKDLPEDKQLKPVEMTDTELKLNVPPGFNVSVEQTTKYMTNPEIPEELKAKIIVALKLLEEVTGSKLGTITQALFLLSVRSGAKESMPGMMDTILNLYLNENLADELAQITDPRFAYDSRRRFLEMFGSTVLGVEENEEEGKGFGVILKQLMEEYGVDDEYQLSAEALKELSPRYIKEMERQGKLDTTKVNFGLVEGSEANRENAIQAMMEAIERVMFSTFTARAMEYRKREGLALKDTTSAENVLGMIFGNRNDKSGTGVLFTRDNGTGKKMFYKVTIDGKEVELRVPAMEFAFYAQGEDVVKGRKDGEDWYTMLALAPDVAINISLIAEFMELHYKEVQDMEFTFEYDESTGNRTLYILQTRRAKRSSEAEIKTMVDLVKEGLVTKEQALEGVSPGKLPEQFADRFNPKEIKKALEAGQLLSDVGLNTLGAGAGRPVFSAKEAIEYKQRRKELLAKIGANEALPREELLAKIAAASDILTDPEDILTAKHECILVTEETAPEDLEGMLKSAAIITSKGGRTSHAAIVAKQFGKAAIVGIKNMHIDIKNGKITFTQKDGSVKVIKRDDIISADALGDGEHGRVILGELKTMPSKVLTAQYIRSVGKVKQYKERVQKLMENINYTGELSGLLMAEYKARIKEYDEFIEEFSNPDILTQEEWNYYDEFTTWMKWADEYRMQSTPQGKKGMGIYANVEKWKQFLTAINNGATGVSLFRIEHTFQSEGREAKFQEMILTEDNDLRSKATQRVFPQLQSDLEQIFIVAEGKPVIIRLIDPPLHEFLPHKRDALEKLARELLVHEGVQLGNITDEMLEAKIKQAQVRIASYAEENPMFGLRGVRLSIVFPEILDMQATALFSSLKRVQDILDIPVNLEIMIPLTGNVEEIRFVKAPLEAKAKELGVKRSNFQIGTMAEIHANGINAEAIAKEVDFVSFGTNDFTQGGYGINRDGGADFIDGAGEAGVLKYNPFQSITPEMNELVARAAEAYRRGNPDIHIGICGEHGGDATSVKKTFGPNGFNYVGAGPLLVPSARAAAAQEHLARLKGKAKEVKRKARPQLLVNIKKHSNIEQIAKAETLQVQLERILDYVKENGYTKEAKEAAFANLKVDGRSQSDIKASLQYLSNNPEIIKWANEVKEIDIEVKRAVGDSLADSAMIAKTGVINTEGLLLHKSTRSLVQEYLMRVRLNINRNKDKDKYQDNEDAKQKLLSTIQSKVVGIFSSYLVGMDDKAEIRVRLPNINLESIFVDEGTSLDAVLDDLSKAIGISKEEAGNIFKNYKDANPAIEVRGTRVLYTTAMHLYTNITQGLVEGSEQAGVETLDIILPFVTNAEEVRLIKQGVINKQGKTIIPSLDKSIEQVKNNIVVNIGADIETPVAVMSTDEVGEYANSIIIPVKELTEKTWSAFEGDTRKGFLDIYLGKQEVDPGKSLKVWEKDPFKHMLLDVSQFVQEAVLSVKESNPGASVSVEGNALDEEAITLAHKTNADSVIVDEANAPLAVLLAAKAASIYTKQGQDQDVSSETTAEVKRPDIKRIGVLTGGGLAAGHNSLINAMVKEAKREGKNIEIFGIKKGWAGLIDENLIKEAHVLNEDDVDFYESFGGSLLKSSRTNPFSEENIQRGIPETIMDNIKRLKLDALVTCGGDDTSGAAAKLQAMYPEFPILAVPKTMDNDIVLPDGVPTYGYDTFVEKGAEIAELYKRSAIDQERIFIVEVFGRNSGFTALGIGAEIGATRTLIPEEGTVDFNQLIKELQSFYDKHKYGIVIVSEGVKIKEDETNKHFFTEAFNRSPVAREAFYRTDIKKDDYGHPKLKDASRIVAAILNGQILDKETKKKVTITMPGKIDYAAREADTSEADLIMTRKIGKAAVKFLREQGINKRILYVDLNGEVQGMDLIEKLGGRQANIKGYEKDFYVFANRALFPTPEYDISLIAPLSKKGTAGMSSNAMDILHKNNIYKVKDLIKKKESDLIDMGISNSDVRTIKFALWSLEHYLANGEDNAMISSSTQQAITNLIEARDKQYFKSINAAGTADLIGKRDDLSKFTPGSPAYKKLMAAGKALVAGNIVSYNQIPGHMLAAKALNAGFIAEVARSQLGYALDENKVVQYIKEWQEKLGFNNPLILHGDHIQYTEKYFKQMKTLEAVYDKKYGKGAFAEVKDVNTIEDSIFEEAREMLATNTANERKDISAIVERLIKAGFTSIAIDASTMYDELAGDAVLAYYSREGATAAQKLVSQLEEGFYLPLEWGADFLKADPIIENIVLDKVKNKVVSEMQKRNRPETEIKEMVNAMVSTFGILREKAREQGIDEGEVIKAYDQIMLEIGEATVAGKLKDEIKAFMGKKAMLLLPSSNAKETAFQLRKIDELVAKYNPELTGKFGKEVEVGHVDKKVPNPRLGGKLEAKMTHPMTLQAMGDYLEAEGLTFDLIATNNGSGHGTEFDTETLTPVSQVGKISPFLTEELNKKAAKYNARLAQHGTSGSDMKELSGLAKAGEIKFNIATNYQQIIMNVLSLVDDGYEGDALLAKVKDMEQELIAGLHETTRAKMLTFAEAIGQDQTLKDIKETDNLFTKFLKGTFSWGVKKEKIKDVTERGTVGKVLAKESKRVFGEMDKELSQVDNALVAEKEVGGINLDPALLDLKIKRDDNFVPIPMTPVEIENIKIEGFIPVIINVTPVTNLPMLVGFAVDTDENKKADANDSGFGPMDRKAKLDNTELNIES